MKRLILLLLLSCCADRAALDVAYREERRALYLAECERVCGRVFDGCLRRMHGSGACGQHYNDCARECQ